MTKIPDEQLLGLYESGVTLREIADKFNYGKGGVSTLSHRLSKLKDYKYKDKVTLTRINNAATRILSIQKRMIEEAGLDPNAKIKAHRKVKPGKIILELEEVG